MGRKKKDRRDKVMLTFEGTKPLKARLEDLAKMRGITLSALIRAALEQLIENREL